MEILHSTSYFLPEYSGTSIRLYNLISRVPFKMQVLTSNITLQGQIIGLSKEQIGNIYINRIPVEASKQIFRRRPLKYLHTIYQKPRIIFDYGINMNNHFDIIHAHNSGAFGQAGKKLSQNLGKPLVFELHAVEQEYTKGIMSYVQTLYINKQLNMMLKSSSHVISLTQALKEWVCHSYHIKESNITVVPNGADINQFSPTQDCDRKAKELKEKFGVSGKVIMYAGYMDRMNGIIDLVEVIPSIIHERPKICFIFIGRGPEERRIIALSQIFPDNIKYISMVPYSEMPSYYQMCDVFLIPRPATISTETIIPLKLLEIMAMEKIVLGSDVGGISEVIKHGYNGYLFKKGNLDNFKKILFEILDADDRQVGKKARTTIMDNYSWEKSANILKKIYEDLA